MQKKIFSVISIFAGLLLMSSSFNSCVKEETFSKATVETNQVTSITEATAKCGGMISADGGSTVSLRGVCWSTSPNPTIENDTTIDAAGTGLFTSLIMGLTPSTTYFVRAYAVNKGGVGYGLQVTFTTKPFSIFTTPIAINLVTATTAICGGTISSIGGATVTERGVCWNTTSAPTIANSKVANGSGSGTFTSCLTGLTPGTIYYVRSYATNSIGTLYGNEVTFSTQSGVIDLETTATSAIMAYTASSGGTITYDGGSAVT